MRVLEISVNATSCNVVTVPPHDVIQKKMTPWVQLTAEGTWPHDRCVWGGSGYCGEKPPHTVISHVRLPGWGCKRRRERIGFFFLFCSPSHDSAILSIICSILSVWLQTQVITVHYYEDKKKKKKDKSNKKRRTNNL